MMRALWAQELVTSKGEWHSITDAGLNPLPVQKPIPIWIGGYAEPVLRRIGTASDGWVFGAGGSGVTARRKSMEAMIETVHGHAREAGRDPADIGLEAMVRFAERGPEGCAETIAGWKERGATLSARAVSFTVSSRGTPGGGEIGRSLRRVLFIPQAVLGRRLLDRHS